MVLMKKIRAKLKNRYKNFIFNLSRNNNFLYLGFYRFFYKPKKGSLAGFIDQYSRAKEKIIVIQVGANDGFNHDPIHKFIKRDGWQGVLIEPQKDIFEKFLQPLHEKSEGINTLNAAVDYNDGRRTLYTIAFCKSRWATGLAGFNRDILVKSINSGFVASCAAKEGIEVPDSIDDCIDEVIIPVYSASTLLKKFKIDKVNFLQIDTEGFDFEIMKIFKIEDLNPEIIVFENTHLTQEDKNKAFQYLLSSGYRYKNFGGNTLAYHNSLSEEYTKAF